MDNLRELTREEKLKLHCIANTVMMSCNRLLLCISHLDDASLDCLCDSYQYIGSIDEFISDMAGFCEEFSEHMGEYLVSDDKYANKHFHEALGL